MTTNKAATARTPARVIPSDTNVTILASVPLKPDNADPVAAVSPEKAAPKVAPAKPKPAAKAPPKPAEKALPKLVVKTKQKPAILGKFAFRHAMVVVAFILLVIVPTTLTSLYMAFIARDQYHSAASFSVRSIQNSAGSDILGMFTQSSSGSTSSDSFVLLDYIVSQKMVEALEKKFDLEAIFGRRGADFFYALSSGEPIEDKVDYWRRMVSVNYDNTSGIINLRVRAFEPGVAEQLTAFIVAQSEELVNDLSRSARTAVLATAQSEVKFAEERLSNIRSALRNFRGASQEASPEEGARLASQIVATLEQQLVQLNTELSTARTQMGSDSPRVRVILSKIASVEKQLDVERQRFGNGDEKSGRVRDGRDVAGRMYEFETLETEREFAERAYSAALAGLEKARMEASAQQRYLAVFIDPTVSELAQYPGRFMNSLLVLLGGLFFWGVAVLGFYNIRDRN